MTRSSLFGGEGPRTSSGAGADDDLADASPWVDQTFRRHRREALVDVHVAVQDQVRAGVVERAPHVEHRRCVVGETRTVPVRESAVGGVRREIGPQPPLLLGTGGARRRIGPFVGACPVDRHHVPCPDIEAVALRRGRRRRRSLRPKKRGKNERRQAKGALFTASPAPRDERRAKVKSKRVRSSRSG
jgi:hypothetical protein